MARPGVRGANGVIPGRAFSRQTKRNGNKYSPLSVTVLIMEKVISSTAKY